MLRKLLFIALLLLPIAILSLIPLKHWLRKPDLSCAVVHKPIKAECPKGYVQEQSPRFTERDGSKEFACLSSDPTKEQCTDMLKGGESEEFRLEFPPEPPAPKPAGERKL